MHQALLARNAARPAKANGSLHFRGRGSRKRRRLCGADGRSHLQKSARDHICSNNVCPPTSALGGRPVVVHVRYGSANRRDGDVSVLSRLHITYANEYTKPDIRRTQPTPSSCGPGEVRCWAKTGQHCSTAARPLLTQSGRSGLYRPEGSDLRRYQPRPQCPRFALVHRISNRLGPQNPFFKFPRGGPERA